MVGRTMLNWDIFSVVYQELEELLEAACWLQGPWIEEG
jgi:hypothetical protein